MTRSTDTKTEKTVVSKANGEKKEHVRKKVWKPKTKTGCITCRIRRVKCDEGKPSCHRCISTGRRCDGYTTPGPFQPSYEVNHTSWRSPLSSTALLDLQSNEEQEAFHFFQKHSASELSGIFDSVFWQFEILQASHSLPAVRHALIALAAMHRKFIDGRMPVVSDDPSDRTLRFALQQSNRAIQEIIKSPTTPARKTMSDKITIMTSCILFHLLACIQGHQQVALEHLRSGLKILRELDEEVGAGTEDMSTHPISLDTLRVMFVAMDVQARGVMGEELLVNWEPHPNRRYSLQPVAFKTFTQARFFFEFLFNDLIAFMQHLDLHPPQVENGFESAIREHQRLRNCFEEGSVRLESFLSQFSDAKSLEDRDLVRGIRIMQLQVKVFLRLFAGLQGATPISFIDWHINEHDMGVILDLASDLLKAPRDLSIPAGARPEEYYPPPEHKFDHFAKPDIPSYSRPIFSSGSGLLSALWLVTSRANSAILRRRAIAMLLDYPRREGVWDSVLAGRVAWETLILEETAQNSELGATCNELCSRSGSTYLDECNRVRDINLKYTDIRTARIELRSVKQYEAGEAGFVSTIAW